MSIVNRTQLKDLASNIERLAKEFQLELDNNKSGLSQANVLDKTVSTLIFCLGGLYVTETKKMSVKASQASRTYVRDSKGRFASRSH